jgi:phosphomevalonate kinase
MLREMNDEHTAPETISDAAIGSRAQFGEVTVSSPGKVLIAGGYLILEKENLGITVAGSSRFYATVRKSPEFSPATGRNGLLRMIVRSPQFHERYIFGYDVETDEVCSIEGSNVFVAKCLQLVFSFLRERQGVSSFRTQLQELLSSAQGLEIILQADNDFYSQLEYLQQRQWPISAESLRKLPKFLACPVEEDGKVSVAKTGLGSSATLTTSLVAVLLRFFGMIQLAPRHSGSSPKKVRANSSTDSSAGNAGLHNSGNSSNNLAEDLRIVHNLAQLVHCKAQGKIGSGFDVASAVYGTQVYQRFSPDAFASLLEDNGAHETASERASFAKRLVASVLDVDRSLWDQVIQPFRLPSGLTLLLGDVCGGSNSPAMARAVLNWKAQQAEEAKRVWGQLAQANRALLSALQQLLLLEQTNAKAFTEALVVLATHSFVTHDNVVSSGDQHNASMYVAVKEALEEVHRSVMKGRSGMRIMGTAAGVEIEPQAQTDLCDATMSLAGVVAAAVPGAGGNDAIFALVIDTSALGLSAQQPYSPVDAVESFWAQWGSSTTSPTESTVAVSNRAVVVCPLLLRPSSSHCKSSGKDGVRVEE